MMKSTAKIILLATICLGVWGLAACGSQAVKATPATVLATQAQSGSTEIASTPGEEEIRAAIVSALMTLNDKPNRTQVTVVVGGGAPRSSVIEFIPPARKHIVDIDEGAEFIIVGEKVYSKTKASGEWAETKIPASTFMGSGEATEKTISDTISNANLVRHDTLDGKPVIVYRYDSTTKSGDIDLHSKTELWVGEADGLPYKMVIDGEILSAATDPATGESLMQAVNALTTTLIAFDPTLRIEAPLK